MYLSFNKYSKILRLIGFVFVCFGLFKGYSAIESMQDKTVNVVLNGVSRNDILAKLMGLFIPFILISVGLWLTMTKSKTLINVHKIREQFWDIFHGK